MFGINTTNKGYNEHVLTTLISVRSLECSRKSSHVTATYYLLNCYYITLLYPCWFVRGRIKEKISTIYAIKYQVYCMENTVQWSANTVQLF